MYIAFLDEFGHIGPFVSRTHKRYGHSPLFGLAGYIIPHRRVRHFATWFFQLKNQVLDPEIRISGRHPATWEKKGSDLFTSKNISKYQSISLAAKELLTRYTNVTAALFTMEDRSICLLIGPIQWAYTPQ